jgi:hypothetical protein
VPHPDGAQPDRSAEADRQQSIDHKLIHEGVIGGAHGE